MGIALATVLVFGAAALTLTRGPHPAPGPHRRSRRAATSTQPVLPAAESGLLPWSLPEPLSRAVALPGPGQNQLTLAGGLMAGGGSSSAVTVLDLSTGGLGGDGSLEGPLHDASGASVGGRNLIFGGGTATSSSSVQALSARSGPATPVGSLSAPRSDSVAVTIGGTAYVVGGYDGRQFATQIVATSDGTRFKSVASLPLPVRYPAVAALGGRIYVFGGLTAGGEVSGAIQMIDPVSGAGRLIGHLPVPVMGASAAVLRGVMYVFGGVASSSAASPPLSTIWAFDPATSEVLVAGQLRVAEAHAAVAVVGGRAWIVGGESAAGPIASVQMLIPNSQFGRAGVPGAGSPYFGSNLLIADSGSNRLLLLNPSGQVVWTYPSASAPPPAGGFYYPDDAFFADHGSAITINMEDYQEILKIAFPSGKVLWTYGHPGVAGSSPGYLHTPDDAYQLKSGQISVADIANCRVLIINPNGSLAQQLGTTGVCRHQPPTDLGAPNGDTPLPDGNLLISEIDGPWISEYTVKGGLVWTAHIPSIPYPSDPQQLGSNLYLVSGYTSPGQIVEFNQQGTVLYRYAVASGPGELNHPSLVELLPSGVFMLNDDHNDRMIAIDPATGAAVWQYGTTGVPGTAPGQLNSPDGFDVLTSSGTTPTHLGTG